MDVGLFVPLGNGNANAEVVRAVGREAEDRGFESIWVPEHVVLFDDYASSYPYSPDGKFPGGVDSGLLEPLTALTYLAAVTDRIRLGTGICLVAQRNPVYTAKQVTDLDNLFGAVKFYQACRRRGVKPIIGVDAWMEPTALAASVFGAAAVDKSPSRLTLLVQDLRGYRHLCELLARAWTGNTQRTLAHLRWDWLAELGAGLVALSGADQGAVGAALLAGDGERARALGHRRRAEHMGLPAVPWQLARSRQSRPGHAQRRSGARARHRRR